MQTLTQNLTANGRISLPPTFTLTPAHRDDAGNVYVLVSGLGIAPDMWRQVNHAAHLFRPTNPGQ